MSWLNLNQSLSSLKGQITNFASEVLSENTGQDSTDGASSRDSLVPELEEKCRRQELEIANLQKLNEELQANLQSERLSRRNGVKEEESSWYWDPPSQPAKPQDDDYKQHIRALQDELSTLRQRDTIEIRPDTEEEIARLREENLNLTSNLEDLDNQHQLAMERLLSLKKELQRNFEVLKQEHEDLKSTNSEYADQVQDLLAKIKERDVEIEMLKGKNDYETLHHKYMNLEKVHSMLRDNAEKFQEENQELHEEVFKLQEQVTKLEHEIEIATKHSEMSNTVPRDSYEELLKEFNEIKDRRNSNLVQLDEINIDDNAKGVIETLKRDISELKHKLAIKESSSVDNIDNRAIKAEKIMQLYNKYVNFELPVDYIGEMPSSDDNIALFKLESAFKTLNSFKKDIDTLEHKISEKNHNINHLQTHIDDLTTENDFLTTDIQHFETELNEMKKNNDFLISEIAALKNTSKLEPIIETHEDNLVKLETELADCNRINKTFESEIKKIETELAEVNKDKIILQDSLADLRTKYTAMLNELETVKNETTAVAELENNATHKHAELLKKATDEIDDLKKRLNAANAKIEQLSIDIHIIENDKVLLTKEVDDLKHSLEEKASAHKELESLKITLEHKLHDLEHKLDEILDQKEEIESHKMHLLEKVTVLENEMADKGNTNVSETQVNTIIAEKLQLSEKLKHTLQENTTLNETMDRMNDELTILKRAQQQLLDENSSLKNSSTNKIEKVAHLQRVIEDMKAKLILQEELDNEIKFLKEENHKLVEKKLHLEAELTSTDNKIVHLEEEFEKLISDLNEKDNLIDSLNSTISQNNINLANLTQNLTDLTKSVEVKNQEIARLKNISEEASKKLNETTTTSDRNHEELKRLQTEKEDLNRQVFTLHEELTAKNTEISKLTNHLEENKNILTEYKTLLENKDKEIKELNQSIIEQTDKLKTVDNITHQNDDYAKIAHEKEAIEKELQNVKNNFTVKVNELAEISQKCEQLEKTCTDYKTIIENATSEKSELINLVTLKHNESIQYHNEIQRLNHVILEQTNEFKRFIEEKDKLLQNQSDICSNCEKLIVGLKEKDEIIMSLNQNLSDYERMKNELHNANETVKALTEKCGALENSLASQLEAVKKLTADHGQLSDQEHNSTKELERLRRHLLELEENYTQELMTSEQKLTECQARLHQVEERAKQNSTVYTSNSIRANQEVETLRNQIKLMEKQREDVQARLSEAEDARSRSEAALTNLQVVLEQFQLDKERDIKAATEKIRNKMEDLKQQNHGLQDEIERLKMKLEESLAGLRAASRLGDQVESKTALINDLKEQVKVLQESVREAEARYHNATSNQQDKVDKNLVKNLVINYVQTANMRGQNKLQVLRILSTVLDFNQEECEKLGLARAANNTDSIAAEFVKFLQNESRPRAALPSMMDIAQTTSRSSTPPSRRTSTLGPNPIIDMTHRRNPSTGSNNLLFQNLDNVETSSQISIESETHRQLDTGVTQTRNTEGAILKHVLKDM